VTFSAGSSDRYRIEHAAGQACGAAIAAAEHKGYQDGVLKQGDWGMIRVTWTKMGLTAA
jgi:hypothetical protein